MFTGIITHLGKLKKTKNSIFEFSVSSSLCAKLKKGASIAINGVCLTVTKKTKNSFVAEIMPETREKTMLGNLKTNDLVNLELPMTANSFLSGHVVQGHVDGTGKLIKIIPDGNSWLLKIEIPNHLIKYIVSKGSVAINGISLTVIEADKNYFTVGIIPHTWKNTMLHKIKISDAVNIETDIIAKYLEKLYQK